MRRASAIQKDATEIGTVEDLTSVFESIASTQVAKVKNKVELSKDFFTLLWTIYKSIRVDPSMQIVNRGFTAADDGAGKQPLSPADDQSQTGKQVFIVISAEAGLSGDIDQRLIETMLKSYEPATTDIIVIGSHGAGQLVQRSIPYRRYFRVPESDRYINVTPIIKAVLPYDRAIVYYEEYVSLGVQEVATIDLLASMQTMSQAADATGTENVITSQDTIFEPSLEVIADQIEMTMMTLALSQTILESSLAQSASRFNAMALAKKRAVEMLAATQLEYHRAKRSESDRRLREVMVSIKKKRSRARAKTTQRHHR